MKSLRVFDYERKEKSSQIIPDFVKKVAKGPDVLKMDKNGQKLKKNTTRRARSTFIAFPCVLALDSYNLVISDHCISCS